MTYKNAWNCKKCPESNGDQGCPCWVDTIVETNIQTGEDRINKGCLFIMLPRWLTHVIQASNRPAAAIESMRNAIVDTIILTTNNHILPMNGRKMIE